MLGGDEVFVAADPRFEAYVHNIIGELDTTTLKGIAKDNDEERENVAGAQASFDAVPAAMDRIPERPRMMS